MNPSAGRFYFFYFIGFALFCAALALGESFGMSARAIGFTFLFATIALYAGVGVLARTSDLLEFYVAGRGVPGIANGMATAADWVSAASFIGLAGIIYHQGFEGLAYVTGWTGGFVLVGLLLGPYLRKFGRFTIPEFLDERYGSAVALAGVAAVVLASFVYLVAQIYGVGLIASRFVGVDFGLGVLIGMAGILVCSFLGGMRAVTWTQVSQYLILIVAYLAPILVLSVERYGVPLPHLAMGEMVQTVAQGVAERRDRPDEQLARALYRARAEQYQHKIDALPASLAEERETLERELARLRQEGGDPRTIYHLERQRQLLPTTPEAARAHWRRLRDAALAQARPPRDFSRAWHGDTPAARQHARINFLALLFVLMCGTAALPHILMRYYTTPTVSEARKSTAWTLFFVALLYLGAPIYAMLAKIEVLQHVVGHSFDELPAWLVSWYRVGLVSFEDINGDGKLQLAELALDPDGIVLALPEMGGLPAFFVGLVAAGGLAAALSTADGLLLTISNALGHDLYYRHLAPQASTQRRLVVSKMLLLAVAIISAWVATLRFDSILLLVGLAFSLAASLLFPTLILGIFWRRASPAGALLAMALGLGTSLGYYFLTHEAFGGRVDLQLFGIQPVACGIFGVLAGLAAHVVVSLVGPAPSARQQALVDFLRRPS
ncbi:MAG: cation/acetate symporter [Tepidiphilus sp.]|nr:cation/acetate symporter [Tepidiphilus sp.]